MRRRPNINTYDLTEFTTAEVGIMMGLHRNTVLKRIESGMIPVVSRKSTAKTRNHYRISAEYLAYTYPTMWDEMRHKLAMAYR
jgi:hypothetical protein